MQRTANGWLWRVLGIALFCLLPLTAAAADDLNTVDQKMLEVAQTCRSEVVSTFDKMVKSGRVKQNDLFDTFYIPIPNTSGMKFQTRYDKAADAMIQPLIDKCKQQDNRIVYLIIVDQNGYAPTHNSSYDQPLTGDPELDIRRSRSKRIFDDRTGMAAAHNLKPVLLQRYNRDTGQSMTDLSIPIQYKDRHWGALRVGYTNK